MRRAAATMPGGDRKDLAVQVLARSATVSDLSTRLYPAPGARGEPQICLPAGGQGASRLWMTFFISTATDDRMLFQVQVTKRSLRQVRQIPCCL